jgi:hypothetical protein
VTRRVVKRGNSKRAIKIVFEIKTALAEEWAQIERCDMISNLQQVAYSYKGM